MPIGDLPHEGLRENGNGNLYSPEQPCLEGRESADDHRIDRKECFQSADRKVLEPFHIAGEQYSTVHEDFPNAGPKLRQNCFQSAAVFMFRGVPLPLHDPKRNQQGSHSQSCHDSIDDVEMSQTGFSVPQTATSA